METEEPKRRDTPDNLDVIEYMITTGASEPLSMIIFHQLICLLTCGSAPFTNRALAVMHR